MRLRLLLPLLLLCAFAAAGAEVDLKADPRLAAIVDAFSKAYGKDFGGLGRDAKGAVVLRWGSAEFLYDDGREKTFEQMLEAPDIKDTFSKIYPLENPVGKIPENFDPGRFRVEELSRAMYGASEAEVSQSCVPIDFCGTKVRFNSRCGAAAALTAVAQDLQAVFEKKPALREYATNLGGTFNWRTIAGTTRLSNHSFGNAIDLSTKKSAYWRWDPPARLAAFRRDWPVEIVEAFERHGFIWGGKWWHYDTMHFEYRPELLLYARAQAAAAKP
jgi:hypothetical protein